MYLLTMLIWHNNGRIDKHAMAVAETREALQNEIARCEARSFVWTEDANGLFRSEPVMHYGTETVFSISTIDVVN